MFRGAIILAAGYIAGYVHSSSQNEQVSKAVQDLRQAWADAKTPTTEPETGKGDENTVTYQRMTPPGTTPTEGETDQ